MTVETIDHFIRNESNVYFCVMNLNIDFSRGQHSMLFKKLLESRISTVYICVLMEPYQYKQKFA